MRTAQRIASAAGLMLAVALATSPGCSDYDDDDGYDRDRRGDYYDDRYSYRDRDRYDDDYDRRRYRDDDRDYGRDWDRDRDRDDDHDRDDAARVPRDANLVANGNDALAYTAGQSGRVYVRDEKSGKVDLQRPRPAGSEGDRRARPAGRRGRRPHPEGRPGQ